MRSLFVFITLILLQGSLAGQHEIPTFGACKGGTVEELERCSMANLTSHLNRKMSLLKDDYISMGFENTLPIVIKMTISPEGEYTHLKVYDTQWKLDLSWLTRDAKKKWIKGARAHDFTLVAQYHFSSKNSFRIEAPEDETIIMDALARAQAEDDFAIGTDLMNNGNYKQAIDRLASHLKYYSNNSNAIYNLALCYDRLGDTLKSCLYWNYLADKGDVECRRLVRDYCKFDFSSSEALQNIDIELMQVVTVLPQYPGGDKAMHSFLEQMARLPDQARKKRISGRVLVSCTIDISGKVKDAKVTQSLGYGCDEEALKAVNSMPDWIPGNEKGKPADIVITIPVYFNY